MHTATTRRTPKQPPPLVTTASQLPSAPGKHPKYKIEELLRAKFGQLGFKDGILQLSLFCKLKKPYTVNGWMQIPAGSETEINHLVLFSVLEFFDLYEADELLTDVHKKMLNQKAAQWQK